MMARPAANSAHKHDSQCRPQFGGGQVRGPQVGRLRLWLDPSDPDGAVGAGSNVVSGAGRAADRTSLCTPAEGGCQ